MLESAPRHYCRNLRCRSRLKLEVENPRHAFCCRGCFTTFHRLRCVVCERPTKTGRAEICHRPKCRYALRQWPHVYRFPRGKKHTDRESPVRRKVASRSAHFTGIKSGDKDARAWRQVAGPELSPRSFTLATLPTDTVARIERLNEKISVDAALIGPKDAPINVLGGYRFPNAPKFNWLPRQNLERNLSVTPRTRPPTPAVILPDDPFAIPAFLLRAIPAFQRSAA